MKCYLILSEGFILCNVGLTKTRKLHNHYCDCYLYCYHHHNPYYNTKHKGNLHLTQIKTSGGRQQFVYRSVENTNIFGHETTKNISSLSFFKSELTTELPNPVLGCKIRLLNFFLKFYYSIM